jgi:hypothetical protein
MLEPSLSALLPNFTETSTDKHDANDKTNPAKRYVSAALHGVRWFFVKVWTVLHSSKFWIASTTVVIAVSTIVYTIYAGRQWKEMRTQSKQAYDTAKRKFSAYVEFESGKASVDGPTSRVSIEVMKPRFHPRVHGAPLAQC